MGRLFTIRPAITVIGPSIAYIDLLHGRFALIDAWNADRIGSAAWNAMWNPTTRSYYAGKGLRLLNGRKTVYMHSIVFNLEDGDTRDHLNLITLDNREVNLRPATQRQNSTHRGIRSDNSSGHVGVQARGKKWRARITVDGRLINLGTFNTKGEAIAAYRKAAEKHHGEFANHSLTTSLDTP